MVGFFHFGLHNIRCIVFLLDTMIELTMKCVMYKVGHTFADYIRGEGMTFGEALVNKIDPFTCFVACTETMVLLLSLSTKVLKVILTVTIYFLHFLTASFQTQAFNLNLFTISLFTTQLRY